MSDHVRVSNVVIEQDKKYLLVQEAKKEVYKLWNLPGGHVDAGETLEQAAVREALEETGYEVVIVKPLLTYTETHNNAHLNAFLVKIIGGELHYPPDEILDVKWFTYQEIMTMQALREPSYIIKAVKSAQH